MWGGSPRIRLPWDSGSLCHHCPPELCSKEKAGTIRESNSLPLVLSTYTDKRGSDRDQEVRIQSHHLLPSLQVLSLTSYHLASTRVSPPTSDRMPLAHFLSPLLLTSGLLLPCQSPCASVVGFPRLPRRPGRRLAAVYPAHSCVPFSLGPAPRFILVCAQHVSHQTPIPLQDRSS